MAKNSVEPIVAIVSKLSESQIDMLFRRLNGDDGAPFRKLFEKAITDAWDDGYACAMDRLKEYQAKIREGLKGRVIPVLEHFGSHLENISSVMASRNRKSAPATIQRNITICDEKKKTPSLSIGQLAKVHGITRQAVSKILKAEAKWRGMSTNKSVDTISKNGVN